MVNRQRVMYLSVEELWRLSHICRPIEEAFGGHYIYLVGSVLTRDDWRDVDLRLVLPDEEYGRMFKPLINDVSGAPVGLTDQFRMLLQTSISMMLRESTKLPIDFQIQSETESEYYEGQRNPVTLRPYINFDSKFKPQWHNEVVGVNNDN